ncbi:MAG: hypothetical protein CMJ94_02205 [Planctomycetes bacterium]|nr:hypothetical protein [Planctomycetota bacterium]
MSYARARLWLGISSVGFWVVLSLLGLALGLPQAWVERAAEPGWGSQFSVLAQALLVYLLLALPFDLIGGWVLPRRFGRSNESLPRYGRRWLRGVAVQTVVLLLCAAWVLAWGRAAGGFGAALAVFGASLLLLALQTRLAAAVAWARRTRVGRKLIWESRDPGFAGGWAGLPGAEVEVQPQHWRELLDDQELHAQETRRAGVLATGSRGRAVALALAFNLLGFVLAAQLPGAGVGNAAELIMTGLGFAIWSFLGLLVLPTPSRSGVYEADHYALQQRVDPEVLIRAARKLDRLQEDEAERAGGVELIFHPVPSVENRVARLRGAIRARGAHQATRLALYLSWACLGVLARAVHCNAGRPEVWVLLPSD